MTKVMSEKDYVQLQANLVRFPDSLRRAVQQFADLIQELTQAAEASVAANERIMATSYADLDADALEALLRTGFDAEMELKHIISRVAKLADLQLLGFLVASGVDVPDEVFENLGTTRADVYASQSGRRPVGTLN